MLDVYPARERAGGLPRRDRAARRAGGGRRRAAAGRSPGCPTLAAAEAYLRRAPARGRLVLDARRGRRRRARPRARRPDAGRRLAAPRGEAGASWSGRRCPGACPRALALAVGRARARLRSGSATRRFAAVEQVTVTGSGSSERDRVRRGARGGRRSGMSTLHVDEDALRDAVEPFASVADLRIRPDFPHDAAHRGDRAPARRASSQTGGSRCPRPAAACCSTACRADDLPGRPTRRARRSAAACSDARALAALRDRGRRARRAARARASACSSATGGMTLDLRGGPDLIFGDAGRRARASGRRPRACSPSDSSAGATYLDLRVAEAGRRGRRRTGRAGAEPTPAPDRTAATIRTLNRRLRMSQFSTSGRDFADLQAILPGFAHFDIGKEIPVTCRNPRPRRAPENARL